jgi:drug/metabolite transporter (DMT)-like permease
VSSTNIEQSPPEREERIPLGIILMVGAGLLFAGSSAASKWLVATYPVGEILWTRTVVSLIALSLFVLPRAGLAVFRTRRPGAHLMRGLSQATSQTLLIIAFSLMPLASATAINFSAPLFATLASVFLLKEGVGTARWMALLVGFLGVLLVTGPGADMFQAGALYALGNAVLFGTVTAGVRGMTKTESTETLTMYQIVLLSAAYTLMLPLGFVTPGWGDALLMLCNGVANAIGQYWWTRALHLAPASAVAPFQYLSPGLGAHHRLRGLGRRADLEPADRFRHRGRLRHLPVLARVAARRGAGGGAVNSPGGMSAAHPPSERLPTCPHRR